MTELMNPACKKVTRTFGVIHTHHCMHFSTRMIQNFVLKVSHYIFKSSSYLELMISYCPVQVRSYLLDKMYWLSCVKAQKSDSPVTFCTGHVMKQTLHCPLGILWSCFCAKFYLCFHHLHNLQLATFWNCQSFDVMKLVNRTQKSYRLSLTFLTNHNSYTDFCLLLSCRPSKTEFFLIGHIDFNRSV